VSDCCGEDYTKNVSLPGCSGKDKSRAMGDIYCCISVDEGQSHYELLREIAFGDLSCY